MPRRSRRADARDHPGSAGTALPGVRVTIAGEDRDGVGEIVVETAARFSGYLGEPGAPAPADDPVRTGDLGRLDAEGRLFVVDRRLDRIVRGGENVSPAEVEAVLLEHPAIADAAVVACPDAVLGQVPVAAIVLLPGAPDPGDDALAAHVRASLAGFKVPARFVRLDALPRTAGGKLRRDAVRALLAGERAGELARPGGDAIGWRVTGSGPRQVLLLHGTLSTAAQLDRLAAALARPGDVTVHALDRRGSGSSRLAHPRPLDVAVHVDDLVAYLDARGIDRAAVVGVSFGGVAGPGAGRPTPGPRRRRGRLRAAVRARRGPGDPGRVRRARRRRGGGPPDGRRRRRPPRRSCAPSPGTPPGTASRPGPGRSSSVRETAPWPTPGWPGLDPDGLVRIAAPVAILTGGASEPFYAPIADALAARIPGARRDTLDGLTHPSPITQPGIVAAAVRACLEPTA